MARKITIMESRVGRRIRKRFKLIKWIRILNKVHLVSLNNSFQSVLKNPIKISLNKMHWKVRNLAVVLRQEIKRNRKRTSCCNLSRPYNLSVTITTIKVVMEITKTVIASQACPIEASTKPVTKLHTDLREVAKRPQVLPMTLISKRNRPQWAAHTLAPAILPA